MIDSGAEISAVSTEFEEQIIKNNGTIPTLPLSGLSVHNAVGEKNMKVNRQILLYIKIGVSIIQTELVIPQLNENVTIGYDFLKNNKCVLD